MISISPSCIAARIRAEEALAEIQAATEPCNRLAILGQPCMHNSCSCQDKAVVRDLIKQYGLVESDDPFTIPSRPCAAQTEGQFPDKAARRAISRFLQLSYIKSHLLRIRGQ